MADGVGALGAPINCARASLLEPPYSHTARTTGRWDRKAYSQWHMNMRFSEKSGEIFVRHSMDGRNQIRRCIIDLLAALNANFASESLEVAQVLGRFSFAKPSKKRTKRCNLCIIITHFVHFQQSQKRARAR